MFREAGHPAGALAAMAEPFREWLSARLADRTYFGFVAEHAHQPAGAIGLMTIGWPPHPVHPLDDRRGYVLNVFVELGFRGRGIARNLLAEGEREFQRRGVTYLVLHSTKAGRPLYEHAGWRDTTEMGKALSRTDRHEA